MFTVIFHGWFRLFDVDVYLLGPRTLQLNHCSCMQVRVCFTSVTDFKEIFF